MKTTDYFLKGFISGGSVFIYIAAIVWFISNGKNMVDKPDSFMMQIFMLLLFVISASITGLLVLGKPISLYFNGLKKEAANLLFATLGWLALFLLIVMMALII